MGWWCLPMPYPIPVTRYTHSWASSWPSNASPPPQRSFCCYLFCCWEIQSALSSLLQTLRERGWPGEERQRANDLGFFSNRPSICCCCCWIVKNIWWSLCIDIRVWFCFLKLFFFLGFNFLGCFVWAGCFGVVRHSWMKMSSASGVGIWSGGRSRERGDDWEKEKGRGGARRVVSKWRRRGLRGEKEK